MGILNALDRHGDDFVLPQDFHGPFGAAVAVGHKENRVAPPARFVEFRDPVVDPAAKLHCRLAGHLAHGAVLAHRQLFQSRRTLCAPFDVLPPHERFGRRAGRDVAARRGLPVARLELVAQLPSLILDLLVLRDDHMEPAGRAEKIDNRQRLVALLEPLPDRHDQEPIGRPGRSLRGWIKPAQRFDHVADKLDTCRLEVARGEHVDNAAANRERAVLFDRILPRESGVDQKVGQILRLDLRARRGRE